MAFESTTVEVPDEPVKIVDGSEGASAVIQNDLDYSDYAVFVGGDENVTVATGFPVKAGGVLQVDLGTRNADLWAVADSGNVATLRKLVSS